MDILQQNYPDKFEYIEERDLFDYVYDGESLRTLGGRKNQKKEKSHKCIFKDYEGRYEYRLLNEDDFTDCLNLLNEWATNKEENNEFDEGMDDESVGIKKIFNNYEYLNR